VKSAPVSLRFTVLAAVLLLSQPLAVGQSMDFELYDPPSTLVVPEHLLTRARYPFVDVHNHQWSMATQDLGALAAEMDALNMAVMVNLSGRSGDGSDSTLHLSLSNVRENQPNRFLIFTNISFAGIDDPDWGDRTARQIADDVAHGAAGLKIYKNLGLTSTDAGGKRIPVDDPRMDKVWVKCGELGVPVLIHSGEPAAFWMPRDEHNERWLELKQKPGRYRDPAVFPTWEQIMAEHWNLFAKHPGTQFISAHMGWMANDLQRLGDLLDAHPNVVTEIGAVLAELGRQPHFARRWFSEHQDQVMFGKDAWTPSEYAVYFRTLETQDDYIRYYRRRHAFWRLYGLDLPDDVLRKLYYGNALRLFPQIDRTLFPEE
jgi:predicted TIM-barrel fold metal-dependent hydrolase